MNASIEFTELHSRGKTGRVKDWIKVMEQTRINLASLINVCPQEVVFTTNTTEGTNIVASSIGLN